VFSCNSVLRYSDLLNYKSCGTRLTVIWLQLIFDITFPPCTKVSFYLQQKNDQVINNQFSRKLKLLTAIYQMFFIHLSVIRKFSTVH